MKAPRFRNWFARLSSLNQPQRRQVLDALHPAAGLDQVVALIAQARASGRCCPRCAGSSGSAGKKCVSSSASDTSGGASAYGLSQNSVLDSGRFLGAGYLDVENTVVGLLLVRRAVSAFTLAWHT